MSDAPWGSDVPISMPVPPPSYLRSGPTVAMSGFVFTVNGLHHDLTEEQRDRVFRSQFEPRYRPSTVEWGDEDLA